MQEGGKNDKKEMEKGNNNKTEEESKDEARRVKGRERSIEK